MAAMPPDYDSDPARWRSHDASWLVDGDAHEITADLITERGLSPVLDVGCGTGRLSQVLAETIQWIGADSSALQLADAPKPSVSADATRLPFPSGCFGAVTALWMLYHLDQPELAVAEARRVLRPGGLFFACAPSRYNDPELTDRYPATTFDAEDAEEIVARVFGRVTEVIHWDGPLAVLPDDDALTSYCRSHHLDRSAIPDVELPLTLTKRGCLVVATP